jgi:diguanylate cyclase (GGDEF)-like protein
MSFDYGTVLLSVGLCGLGLAVSIFALWLSTPIDRFLLTWIVGLVPLVVEVIVYGLYTADPKPAFLLVVLTLQPPALAVLWGAAVQFCEGRLPLRRVVAASALGLAFVLAPMIQGDDGLALIAFDAWATILFSTIGLEYARNRRLAPLPLTAIAALYVLCGLSFAACGIELVLMLDGRTKLGVAPVNWVESAAAFVWLISVTGIGALSLAMAHWRRAVSHHREALTDPLTGLLNRRALQERHGTTPLDPGAAVILFDLDRFKEVNDQFGHEIGDLVLIRFAATLSTGLDAEATVARIGGEEFAAVLPASDGNAAFAAAEQVRIRHARSEIVAGGYAVHGTVSAGVAIADGSQTFDELSKLADHALYDAKRTGRNRVVLPRAA